MNPLRIEPEWITSHAHGRVNLIGEHTDYNGGYVFPTAIPQATEVKVRLREDGWVSAVSAQGHDNGLYEMGREARTGKWVDYVQGVTKLLCEKGCPIRGFDLEVKSTIPIGSGLSSSAALEIALLKSLRAAYGLPHSDTDLARLGQRVENEFIGAHVGIMDQMACTFARFGEALLLNTQTLEFERVTLPMHDIDLVVIHSGVTHNLAEGHYNERRRECEEAARLLGVKFLCDLGEVDLPRVEKLPEPLRRRARHAVTENLRVHAAVRALGKHDFRRFGELLYASHASLRSDYEVSVLETNLLVEFALLHPAVYGARITGGGFGGSIVACTKHGSGDEVARFITERFEHACGGHPTVLLPWHSDCNSAHREDTHETSTNRPSGDHRASQQL